MTHLTLEDIGVEFALYQSQPHSFKRAILRASVGGGIGKSADRDRTIVKALDGICIDLREGDRLALVGHNGAGKTTLLRVMSGIYHPTKGNVQHAGRRVPLFDIHSGFDDEATGYENILLRGLLMGFTRSEMERRVDEIAVFSGLGEFLDMPVRTYSSGMLLRLLFSISTSSQADILMMDEWIAAGDQQFIEKANQRLQSFVERSKILVFASHDLKLVRKLCNRALLLDAGRIACAGTVDEVLQAYEKRRAG